jgi:glycosyltransferase involved in cell wall biosynthesis
MRIVAYPAFKNFRHNPYNHMLYTQVVNCGHTIIEYDKKSRGTPPCDVFHFHWPEFFIRRKGFYSTIKSTLRALLFFDRMKKSGVKIVWTIHNLKPHEKYYPFLEDFYWTGMTKRLDGIIALSEDGLRLAREQFPAIAKTPSFVIPHGHYRDIYPQTTTRSAARQQLGIAPSTRVVASVGQLRPYKNIPELIRVYRSIDQRDTILLIAGKPVGSGIDGEIRSAAGKDVRIRLFLGWIDDNELQQYLKAADLLVFPFRDILNSGSALLGLSFDRPILVPRRGAMADLQNVVGPDWVRTYEGELTAEILNDAINWAANEDRGPRAPLDDMNWSSIAHRTIEAYRTVADNTTR